MVFEQGKAYREEKRKKKILVIATTLETLRVFKALYISELKKNYNVTIIASSKTSANKDWLLPGVNFYELRISRKISILNDCLTLWSLIIFIGRNNFDIVHTITPKAGLLGQLSAFFCHVPVRIHSFTGQVWATRTGLSRRFFKAIDKIVSRLATAILVDSHPQRRFLVAERICSFEQTAVIMGGSVCGVDLGIFRPSRKARVSVRDDFNIGENDFVLLFAGRVVREKGFIELLQALKICRRMCPFIKLLIVGRDEESLIHDGILDEFSTSSVFYIGHTEHPEKFMAASDVLCLPSYREGFGVVVLEAAACGLPSIVSDIYGLEDAIIPEITGLKHIVKDVDSLAYAITMLEQRRDLVRQMGTAARQRVRRDFDSTKFVIEQLKFLEDQIAKNKDRSNY